MGKEVSNHIFYKKIKKVFDVVFFYDIIQERLCAHVNLPHRGILLTGGLIHPELCVHIL